MITGLPADLRGTSGQTGRHEPLDVLRGAALLAVILVHSHQEFASLLYGFSWRLSQADPFFLGRHGVQLFFAVSGFTMIMVYEGYRRTWCDPVRVFYLRRILRLYPLLFIAAFAYLYVPLDSHALFNPDGVQVMDFVWLLTLTGGWSPQTLNVLVPGVWSIINEIYFYLLMPFLWQAAGQVKPWLAGSVLAAGNVLLVLKAQDIFAGQDPWLVGDFMYRNLLVNMICFMAGMEAWRFLRDGSRDFPALVLPLLACGLALEWVEAASGGAIRSEVLKLGLLGCFFYFLIIAAFHPASSRFFRSRVLARIGLVTYTGYVVHFAIIHFSGQLVDMAGLRAYATLEVMLPLIIILTYSISVRISWWTERIWQDIADRICRSSFRRAEPIGQGAVVTGAGGEG